MKTIVITGSTRGIGLGMARALLERGCNVVISGRKQEGVDAALASLAGVGPGRAIGQPCDVSDAAQVQALWDCAAAAFGRIDIWINNAALGTSRIVLWEQDAPTVRAVVDTNLLGTIHGCTVAIRGMKAQGGGHIFNFEGFGSGGEIMSGNAPYGVTKAAITYLTKALQAELKGEPVTLSNISPGMVTTDLLMQTMDPARAAQESSVLNILADRLETVAPWLADRILEQDGSSRRIAWLTPLKIAGRFLMSPFRKRDVLSTAG